MYINHFTHNLKKVIYIFISYYDKKKNVYNFNLNQLFTRIKPVYIPTLSLSTGNVLNHIKTVQ